jgi:quercetin dioxygenase-like cupin family protein
LEWVLMSERELQRFEVLSGVVAGRMSVVSAAAVLGLSRRQVHRLLTLYRSGATALRHKARGRWSNRALSDGLRELALGHVRESYFLIDTSRGPGVTRYRRDTGSSAHPGVRENAMKDLNRRAAVGLGLATATAVLAMPQRATAETYGPSYGPTDGKERGPGVRQVDLSRRESMVPGYKTVSMRDIIYQPGSKSQSPTMPNDMVCHCLTGELHIDQASGRQFTVKQGDVWTCAKGEPENITNNGSAVGIMRVIDLLA